MGTGMGLAWSGCGAKLGEGLWLVDPKLLVGASKALPKAIKAGN